MLASHRKPLDAPSGGHRVLVQERLSAALALLEDGVEALLDGPGFAAYLRTMARFHQYSARNVALIHAQRPDATRVAGYRAWQALGRQVRKGEQGIRILAPHRRSVAYGDAPEDEPVEVVTGFGVATVFDISQTDGDPLPAPPAPAALAGSSDTGARLAGRLAAVLVAEGVRVSRADTGRANGCYVPRLRRIVLHRDLDGDQAVKTLAHETAHHVAVTRAVASHGLSRADAETIAEGAAYVVLHHAGLDAGGYTFAYVARWAEDRAVLARNLEAIRLTAHTVIAALDDATTYPDLPGTAATAA